MTQYTKTKIAQKDVDVWNKSFGIGEPVLVKMDDGEIIQTKTRSKAKVMPSGDAVIWVVGITGCYLLERVAPIRTIKVVDPAIGTGAYLANPPFGEKGGEE